MEELMEKIMNSGIGSVIDKPMNSLLLNGEEYQQDCKVLDELKRRYMKLNLSGDVKRIIDDYMACLGTASCRDNDIYYISGTRDILLFLNKTGLLIANKQWKKWVLESSSRNI